MRFFAMDCAHHIRATLMQTITRIFLSSALVVLGVFLLDGCASMEEDDAIARQLIDALRAGDFATVTNLTDPEYRTSQTAQALPVMRKMLDLGELKGMHRIGYLVRGSMGSGPSFRDCSYEIEFSKGWMLQQVRIYHNGTKRSVQSLSLTPLNRSLEAAARFTLAGKSPGQYAFLVLVIVEPLFMLATLVVCVRTRIKRKGLWCLIVLVGVMQFRMNWSTGEMDWRQIAVSLLGVSVFQSSAAAPWVLSFSLPLGAVAFLLSRRSLRLSEAATPPPVLVPEQRPQPPPPPLPEPPPPSTTTIS